MKTYHSEECNIAARIDEGSYPSDGHTWRYRCKFTDTQSPDHLAVAHFDDWNKTAGAALCLVGQLLKDGKLTLVN